MRPRARDFHVVTWPVASEAATPIASPASSSSPRQHRRARLASIVELASPTAPSSPRQQRPSSPRQQRPAHRRPQLPRAGSPRQQRPQSPRQQGSSLCAQLEQETGIRHSSHVQPEAQLHVHPEVQLHKFSDLETDPIFQLAMEKASELQTATTFGSVAVVAELCGAAQAACTSTRVGAMQTAALACAAQAGRLDALASSGAGARRRTPWDGARSCSRWQMARRR